MPENELESLSERLLRAGIAPRHVRRLRAELETHYAMLLDEESRRGQPPELARRLARDRLGTDEDIVAKAREQVALRSWGARWPLAICALGPVLGLLGSAALLVAALVTLLALSGAGGHPGSWARGGTTLVGWSVLYGLPLLWAYVLARYSATRRVSARWAVTGLFLTAAVGALTTFTAAWPHAGMRAQLSGGFGWIGGGAPGVAIRAFVTLVVGLAFYLPMSERLRRRTAI
jgi:hypothetical protein